MLETSSPADALKAELDKKDAEIKRLARELDQARMKSASSSTSNLAQSVKEVKGVKVLAHRVDNLERAQLRTLVDQLRDKIGSGVVVLGSASNGNVALIVGITKDLTGRVQAGKVIGPVAQKVGGKGGGRPDLAELAEKMRPLWMPRWTGPTAWSRRCWDEPGRYRNRCFAGTAEICPAQGAPDLPVDFSNCSATEMLLLIEQIRQHCCPASPRLDADIG